MGRCVTVMARLIDHPQLVCLFLCDWCYYSSCNWWWSTESKAATARPRRRFAVCDHYKESQVNASSKCHPITAVIRIQRLFFHHGPVATIVKEPFYTRIYTVTAGVSVALFAWKTVPIADTWWWQWNVAKEQQQQKPLVCVHRDRFSAVSTGI